MDEAGSSVILRWFPFDGGERCGESLVSDVP